MDDTHRLNLFTEIILLAEKMNMKVILCELIKMMKENKNPIQPPLDLLFIENLISVDTITDIDPLLKKLGNEARVLLTHQPDFMIFLKTMDGFEFNGLTLFSFAIYEPVVKNIFLINEFYRNNDDFIDPDLENRLVIGEDSISLFTYDAKVNLFEIRDNASTESVYGSFDNFVEFLSELLGTVRL